MVFSSPIFLFYFLPLFLAAYFLTPSILGKNLVTLAFSLIFYAWGEPAFLFILMASIAFNYLATLAMDRFDGSARKIGLGAAVVVNLLLLGTYKYAGFVTGNL